MTMPPKPLPDSVEPYADNNNETSISPLPDDNDPISSPGQAMYEEPIADCLIHAELYLPQGEDMKAAKVVGCTKDEDRTIIGTYDHDPMLNSMVYNV